MSESREAEHALTASAERVEHTLEQVQNRALQTYEKWSTIPVFGASLMWLIAILMEFSPALAPDYRVTGIVLNGMVFLAFAADLGVRFILDPRKRSFLRRNWYLAIAVVVPPLRILFVINAILRIRRDSSSLAKQIGLVALYAVTLVVFLGALFTLIAEIDAPGSNIDSYGDAVWWAFVTVTTVGYGDFTPITETGRSIAVLIMFTGAAAVGALTAALASWFAALAQRAPEPAPDDSEPEVSPEQQVIASLHAHVESLQRQVEAISAHLGVVARTHGHAAQAPHATATAAGAHEGQPGSPEHGVSDVVGDTPKATRPAGGE